MCEEKLEKKSVTNSRAVTKSKEIHELKYMWDTLKQRQYPV